MAGALDRPGSIIGDGDVDQCGFFTDRVSSGAVAILEGGGRTMVATLLVLPLLLRLTTP